MSGAVGTVKMGRLAAYVSANPSLHPDEAFQLPQLALAEPPRRGVHGRRERSQRVLGVGAQVRLWMAVVIEQTGGRRGVGVEGVPGRVGAICHVACSDMPRIEEEKPISDQR